MSLFSIDTSKCSKDGICAAVCPVSIIKMDKGDQIPYPSEEADEMCINCGHCVAVCPNGAFSHRSMGPDQCPDINRDLIPDPAGVTQFMRSRRSIRCYKDTPVPLKTLSDLIKLAGFAPSGHNSQAVEWLVIYKPGQVKTYAGMVVDWMQNMKEKHPKMAEPMRVDRFTTGWQSGRDYILRGAPHMVVAHAPAKDATGQGACTIALTYLELAAPTFGVGTCWAGYFQAAANFWQPIKDALGLPKGNKCHGAVLMGYPKYTYQRLPLRNDPKITWR